MAGSSRRDERGEPGRIRALEVKDAQFILDVLTHPEIFRWTKEDGQGPPSLDDVVTCFLYDGCFFLGGEWGHFFYRRVGKIQWEVHTCILPEHRRDAVDLGRESLRWMFENTECTKVCTWVPHDLFHVKRYAERVGMTVEGESRASFVRDGRVLDQWFMGITKDEVM